MSQFMSSGADKAVIYHIVGEIPRLELVLLLQYICLGKVAASYEPRHLVA